MDPREEVVSSSGGMVAKHEIVFAGHRLFPFETRYGVPDFSFFCREHDLVPWIAVSVYVVALYAGLRLMENRKPFSLKGPLILWNMLLASFSVIGFVRMQQEFRYTYHKDGWRGTYCSKSSDNVVGFWIFVFVMSKFLEFGDTLFLVLRKKPVIFLHWYHHVTVLLFSYFTAIDWSANGRWFVTMNYFVHSLMYGYYALQAAGVKVPRVVAMPLTVMQIVQMFLGMYVITMSGMEDLVGNTSSCLNSRRTLVSGFLMYASYLVLFVNFFLKNYVFSKKSQQHQVRKSEANGVTSNGTSGKGVKDH